MSGYAGTARYGDALAGRRTATPSVAHDPYVGSGIIGQPAAPASSITDPRDIPGLVAWYSAEAVTGVSNGATLTSWTDLSGAGNNTASTTNSPIWESSTGAGGGPAVAFPDSYFTLPNLLSGASAGEVMATMKATDTSSVHNGWDFGSDSLNTHLPYADGNFYDDFGSTARKSFTPTLSPASWRRYNVWSAASDWAANLDETPQSSTSTNTVGWASAPTIGSILGGSSSSRFGCVLIYNRKLTSTERAQVADWLTAHPSGGTISTGLTQVTATRSTSWTTRASVTAARATTWATLATAAASRATGWSVLSSTSSNRSTTWVVRAAITATRATSWNIASAVLSSRATTWAALTVATSTRASTWAVAGVLTSVTSTRATAWTVSAAVTTTRATTWTTRSATSSTRTTTWTTRAGISSTRATAWTTRGAVAGTRATSWSTRAATTATRSTTWAVATAATSTRATTWTTLSATPSARATTWATLAAVYSTRGTAWAVIVTLVQVSSSRTTNWRVLAITTATRSTLWDIDGPPAPLAAVVVLVGDDPDATVEPDVDLVLIEPPMVQPLGDPALFVDDHPAAQLLDFEEV